METVFLLSDGVPLRYTTYSASDVPHGVTLHACPHMLVHGILFDLVKSIECM